MDPIHAWQVLTFQVFADVNSIFDKIEMFGKLSNLSKSNDDDAGFLSQHNCCAQQADQLKTGQPRQINQLQAVSFFSSAAANAAPSILWYKVA